MSKSFLYGDRRVIQYFQALKEEEKEGAMARVKLFNFR